MWPDGEIIFQYVVIYYNENMPKCENFPKVGLENFAKYQIAPRKITKDFKICQSGKISANLVTLVVAQL